MLELFPQNYHEPYYLSYLKEDFNAIAAACSLTRVREVNAFVSKVMVFDKARNFVTANRTIFAASVDIN